MRNKLILSKEQLSDYLNDYTIPQLSIILNTNKVNIYRLCRKYGINYHKHKVSYEQLLNTISNNIDTFKEQLISVKLIDLIKQYNTSKDNLYKVIKELNINYNPHYLATKHAQETSLAKYGVKRYSNPDKTKQTIESNYASSDKFYKERLNKIKATKQAKYGDPYYNNSTKAQQTISSTPNYEEKRQIKTRETCIKRYGVDRYSKTEECKNKVKATNKLLYGVDYYQQGILDSYNPDFKSVYYDREKAIKLLENYNCQYTYRELANLFNCTLNALYLWAERLNLGEYIKQEKSHIEDEIVKYIKSYYNKTLIIHNRSILDGLELDIYLPDIKIGIEINGDYWHSDIFKEKTYHLDKSKQAQEKGIHLIHIWEHEWNNPEMQEKMKLFLDIILGRVNKRIYARNCEIKEISNKEAESFNEAYHLQGHRNAKVTYGLFYEGQLVQLMSFSKTKYNRNLKGDNDWEIIRGCPGSNNVVVGGVSKLFSHFVKDYNPDSVFSYCDFNKFDGKSYEALGMKFIGYTGPDKKWFMKDRTTIINRDPSRYKELKENSLAQIWGSGSKKYIWKKGFNYEE